ncbi:hypothetical protein [Sorangium sp. So ce1389]|uniref:hypothetical protein n=1 Tax=Sorangium sp. So ce1389 TaxID=3133336 RepID=UPI003F5F0054
MWRYTERRQAAIWNGRVQSVEQGAIPLFASSCIFIMNASTFAEAALALITAHS